MSTAVIARPPTGSASFSRDRFTLDPPRRTTRCFEVLVPYHDEAQARTMGVAPEARFSLIVNVWATDSDEACTFARERFREHRIRSPKARIAPGGPVTLRLAPPRI
jgi:hypothetical protein